MVLKCYHYKYNDTSLSTCNGPFEECAKLVECHTDNPQIRSLCFALAKFENKPNKANTTTATTTTTPNTNATILSAGCYSFNEVSDSCNTTDRCLGDYRQSSDNYYCCCVGDGCNRQLIPKPKPPVPTHAPSPQTTGALNLTNDTPNSSSNHTVIVFAVIILLALPAILGLYLRRSRLKRKVKRDRNNLLALANRVNDNEVDVHSALTPFQDSKPKFDLELLELVGSGRFGTVHKARNKQPTNNNGGTQEQIAVKIIKNNEYQSFQNELNIYSSSRTRHPNVLTFLGSCESLQTNSNWLLVEFAPNGSLHHYLKQNTVTWDQFIAISLGIVRGLSHLHDADVAHRDFKSKNVLLRQDLSPCITDFGVATMLDTIGGSQTQPRKNYLQVGTPRYMAPEVLECSVAFTKISFTKIDVYALSLVLWELLSRVHPLPKLKIEDDVAGTTDVVPYSDEVQPYKLPFECYVGSNPDINIMRQAVVCDKLRPPLMECWSYKPINRMSQAIVDGWEYDHDARISASCFVERIITIENEKKKEEEEIKKYDVGS